MPDLRVSIRLRPGSDVDLPAVIEIMRAEDLRHLGRSQADLGHTRERLAADPEFDLATEMVLAEADGRLVGVAIANPMALNVAVDPDCERGEVRAQLLDWGEARLRELDRPLRVSVPAAFSATRALLVTRGYTLERFYAEMECALEVPGPPEPARVASGYVLRAVDPVADRRALHALDRRAFQDRPDFVAESAEEFDARHLAFSGFARGWSRLVTGPGGDVVGSLIGSRRPDHPGAYVSLLAVDPAHRGRGLARALLLDAFRAAHALGFPSVALHVASDNPRALDVYRSVGMSETERIEHWIRADLTG